MVVRPEMEFPSSMTVIPCRAKDLLWPRAEIVIVSATVPSTVMGMGGIVIVVELPAVMGSAGSTKPGSFTG